jgi:hypothetical protein
VRHSCPRPSCRTDVDSRLFCCATDWFALSRVTRFGISSTATLSVLSGPRRAAIGSAMEEWRKLDAESEH